MVHLDDTIALVVVKAFVLSAQEPSNVALLEAFYVYTFLGDSSADTYEDNIPNVSYFFIFRLGTVLRPQMMFSNYHVAFLLVLLDYVHDHNKQNIMQ
jgi:hypothetical protein